MTLTLNRRSAYSLAGWSIGVRLFTAAVIDGAALGNSGWLSVLMSGALCLPAALMIALMSRKDPAAMPISILDQACGQWVRRGYCLLLCAFSIYEAAFGARILSLSVEYAAFDKLPMAYLVWICTAVGCAACLGGGIGVGGASQIWRVFSLLMIALIVSTQLTAFHHRWLTPILGPGIRTLFRGAVSFSGMNTAIVSIWLCMSEETGADDLGGKTYRPTGPFHAVRSLAIIVLGTAAAAAMMGMLAPVLPGGPSDRAFALGRLIAHGLNVTELQLPMMLLLFVSLILMLSFYIYTASCMLKCAFPRLRDRLCVLIAGAITIPTALSDIANREWIDWVNALRLPVVTLPLLAIGIVYLFKQRGKRIAQP